MRAARSGRDASVARGVVLVTALCALFVAGRSLRGTRSAGAPPRACAAPVEVAPAGAEPRPGCAGDPELAPCGALGAGDRAVLGADGCARDPGGMRGAWRLAYGLKVDVNRASASELVLVDRIGPKLAAAIVAEREAHGPYAALDDLARVRGMGPALIAAVASQLDVEPAAAQGR